MLLLCSARLITPLVEAQLDADTQLRHICFCDGDIQLRHMYFRFAAHDRYTAVSVVCSICNVYAFALLRAADRPIGRGSTRC